MNGIAYNERSWAIDLIAHIKNLVANQNRSIKDAGGEQTIRTEGSNLFPDVLLFGDQSSAVILQGWELKMPDTGIDDIDFRENATKKAVALGLDSFVLWNVSVARLYVRRAGTDNFVSANEWTDLVDVRDRRNVAANRARWQALATDIVNHINDLLDRHELTGRPFVEAYSSGGITGLIMANAGSVSEALRIAARKNNRLDAEITRWWNFYRTEYGGKDPFRKLAQANLSNWIGKFLFAHILQARDQRAQAVTKINDNTTPEQALAIFEQLSQDCNFWSIFSSNAIGLSAIPMQTWSQLRQLNKLLTELRIGSIDQGQLSRVLEATVDEAVRRLRGQYPTPPVLAKLLVRLSVQNLEEDRILDPCCGSGTISRAALEQKLDAEVNPEQAAASIFAGDNDPLAVQITTFALAKPDLMHTSLRVFRQDAFFLEPTTELEFRDPTTGELFTEQTGRFNAITSNLPFVAQAGRDQYGNAIRHVTNLYNGNRKWLPKRSDVAAYLPFALYYLLEDGGRLGIIITNAWLSTAWGDSFRERFSRYYKLKTIITSGAGRWFQNSDVVANVLIMEKVATHVEDSDSVDFVVLKQPLEELSDNELIRSAATQIELGQTYDETMTIHSVSKQQLKRFRPLGLAGNAQFVNCDWILDLPLVPVNGLFGIRRGERRGWDKMFYPEAGHGIEADYIQPVLERSSDINGYITSADSEAFSCSFTLNELQELGHTGALNWIRRFENTLNGKGKPLSEALARANVHWYEMNTDGLADLVMPLNIDKRIFISKVDPPAFVNQRLIRFNAYEGVDLDLCHALLNTAISMFIIEGMGFGRGLGVLDLSKDRIESFMHMLDPRRLDERQTKEIKNAFAPLLQRELLELADELERLDRQHFDDTVLAAFGAQVSRERIYDSICQLVGIRQSALDRYD